MVDDLPLFQPRPTPTRTVEEQDANLERVSSRIRAAILAFCRDRLGREFFADELRAYVEQQCGKTAPGSADRILRALRQAGEVAYRVVSRSKSLYLVEGI